MVARSPAKADWSLAVSVQRAADAATGFVAAVLGLLDYHGVAPSRLKLELTEGVLLH